MVHFEDRYYLLLLLLVPLLSVVRFVVQKKRVRSVCDAGLQQQGYANHIKFILLMVSLSLLIIGLANPQVSGRKQRMPVAANTQMVFVVDVSKSMLCADVIPYRLALAQQFMHGVLSKLNGQKVGVVLFAGKAQPYIPLTTDYAYVKSATQAFGNTIPKQGTSLRDALKIAQLALGSQKDDAKVICVLSDGESHRLDFGGLADTIRRSGTRVFAFGVGTTAGAPVADELQNGSITAKQPVISRLHPENLVRIAGGATGAYMQLGNIDAAVTMFMKQLVANKQNAMEIEVVEKDYYQLFLLLALLVLIAELFIS